jgi:hypothetical protein
MLNKFDINENSNMRPLKKNRNISFDDISNLKRLRKSDSIEIIEPEKSRFLNIYENFKLVEENEEVKDESRNSILIVEEASNSHLDNEQLKLLYLNDRYESSVFQKVELIFLNLIKQSYENLSHIRSKYKIDELNTDTCIFLLNEQIIQSENEKSPKNDSKLRSHLTLVASFKSLDFLFNR